MGKIKQKELSLVEKVTDIICDKCGLSCNSIPPEYRLGLPANNSIDYADLSWNWGYWSKHDGEYGELYLCENCWELVCEFIKKCNKVICGRCNGNGLEFIRNKDNKGSHTIVCEICNGNGVI